ncbi:unnamed protein product [Musa acuminata subsp. malaccensis]|uniref:(wild Malaysian banana) hypothetical protein n=1 Tax=Musa acuminata subsp. malaccensis TaxID=214687 RepID=A0A804J0W6_MUSAM|nr:PREDICTED: uncharacterized protein LOC103983956 [Musa acuminata subsp. malaccensis]CAG1837517.1 unnamed protein product [Musa acuminata subsp. malaccensis]
MGTKLHQMNNLFTTLQKTNCNVVNAGLRSSDIGAISDNISLKVSVVGGLNQLKASMERQLDCCDTDSLRNTMLKHEEIFKQQVHELHRVYGVQKMLMAELGEKQVSLHAVPSEAVVAVADARTRIWSSASTSDTSHSSHVSNLHQSAPELNSEYSSLNPWSEHVTGFDLEQPAEEYTCRGATSMDEKTTKDKEKRSMKGSFSWPDDGSEIELTLSIGCSSSDKQKKKKKKKRGEECGDDSSGLDREESRRSPWILRAFNLNKT